MRPHLKLIAALVFLAVSVGIAWTVLRPAERVDRAKALDRRELALRVLGRHIAERMGKAPVLVISNPFSQRPGQPREVYAFEEAAIRGLKHGAGAKLKITAVVFPRLNPAALANPGSIPMDPNTTTPISYLTAERAWDELCREHPEASVIVSLVGLPLDLTSLKLWRTPDLRLALLLPDLRMVGDTASIAQAFRSGKLAAVILNRPGATTEPPVNAKDDQEKFNQSFLLVTPENVDDLLKLYPQLF